MKRGKLIVITGPSGVGKSTVTRQARRRTGASYSVSVTTRRPRPGEVDGADYRFIGREAFRRMIDADELLEWADVFGELYGTPEAPVREAISRGERIILEIDVQGGLQVYEKMPEAEFVLIAPPGMDELARRLTGRGSEDAEATRKRLSKAEQELRTARESGAYEHEVVNDDLETAVQKVVAIIER